MLGFDGIDDTEDCILFESCNNVNDAVNYLNNIDFGSINADIFGIIHQILVIMI